MTALAFSAEFFETTVNEPCAVDTALVLNSFFVFAPISVEENGSTLPMEYEVIAMTQNTHPSLTKAFVTLTAPVLVVVVVAAWAIFTHMDNKLDRVSDSMRGLASQEEVRHVRDDIGTLRSEINSRFSSLDESVKSFSKQVSDVRTQQLIIKSDAER